MLFPLDIYISNNVLTGSFFIIFIKTIVSAVVLATAIKFKLLDKIAL